MLYSKNSTRIKETGEKLNWSKPAEVLINETQPERRKMDTTTTTKKIETLKRRERTEKEKMQDGGKKMQIKQDC